MPDPEPVTAVTFTVIEGVPALVAVMFPSRVSALLAVSTNTAVTPSSRCSRRISVRVRTRSAASRLESGSSIRKTDGVTHNRTSHRHALALAAAELGGPAVQQTAEIENLSRRARPARSLSARPTLCCCSPNSMFSRTVICG